MRSWLNRTAFICVGIVFCAALILFTGYKFSLELYSKDFIAGKKIPEAFTGLGEDVSPELYWSDAPSDTKSFVVIMDDPDAPGGTWVHWVIYDIPASVRKLDRGVPKDAVLADGAKQGKNSFGRIGYNGPMPPPGPEHRYFFKLYALDTVLELKLGVSKDEVLAAMKGHIVDQAHLVGLFGR